MSTYEISKSSLLSLKAEILRKEEDLVKAKGENEIKASIIKKKTPLELKNKGVEARSSNDITEEEQDLLKLSSFKLAQKAAIYDKLAQQGNQSEEVKRRYLVQFDQKDHQIQNEVEQSEEKEDSGEERHFSDDYDDPDNSDDEWVEYIDCLGRSRTCLRKDLEYLKSKDADLKIIAKRRKELHNPEENENQDKTETDPIRALEKESERQAKNEKDREQELISGDMKREMLRQQWEKEEAELMNKDELHYQDILFSEARQHGVGYYSFSKDSEERSKQQEELKKLREETEMQQKKAKEAKALREKQLAARMKAARNRKRARMGLPPEEDEPEVPTTSETQDEEKPVEPSQEELRKAEDEKRLEEARKKHIRPWDIGKEGVSEFYEMTQDEWNEKQRALRIDEFAPPSMYKQKKRGQPDRNRTGKINPYLNTIPQSSSDSDDADLIGPPPPAGIGDSITAGLRFLREQAESSTSVPRSFISESVIELPPEQDKSLRFTTKKQKKVDLENNGWDSPKKFNIQGNDDCGHSDSDNGWESPKRLKIEENVSPNYSDSDEDLILPPVPPPPNFNESFEAGLLFLKKKAENKQIRAPW